MQHKKRELGENKFENGFFCGEKSRGTFLICALNLETNFSHYWYCGKIEKKVGKIGNKEII